MDIPECCLGQPRHASQALSRHCNASTPAPNQPTPDIAAALSTSPDARICLRCSRPCTTGDWVTGLRPIHRESRCSVPVRARSALSGASGATGRSGTPWTSNFQASWACRSATLFPCSRTLGGPMFRTVHEVICSVCRECDGGSSGESPDGRTRLACVGEVTGLDVAVAVAVGFCGGRC